MSLGLSGARPIGWLQQGLGYGVVAHAKDTRMGLTLVTVTFRGLCGGLASDIREFNSNPNCIYTFIYKYDRNRFKNFLIYNILKKF